MTIKSTINKIATGISLAVACYMGKPVEARAEERVAPSIEMYDSSRETIASKTQRYFESKPLPEYEMIEIAAAKESPLEIKVGGSEAGERMIGIGVKIGPKYERGFFRSLLDPFIPYRSAENSADGRGKVLPYWREKPVKTPIKAVVYGVIIASLAGGDSKKSAPAPVDNTPAPTSNDNDSNDGGSSPAPAPVDNTPAPVDDGGDSGSTGGF